MPQDTKVTKVTKVKKVKKCSLVIEGALFFLPYIKTLSFPLGESEGAYSPSTMMLITS